MAKLSDMHREVSGGPLAYFVTVRTYGTWLHGDERGAVDREHNQYGAEVVEGNEVGRASVGRQKCFAGCHAQRAHCPAPPEAAGVIRRLEGLKVWGTRRLREGGLVGKEREVWAQHGSTPH